MIRFIEGAAGHWAVGRNFVARLPPGCVTGDGRARADVVETLERHDREMASGSDAYSVIVMVTTRCNLACPYCFQNTELPSHGGASTNVPVRIPAATVDQGRVTSILGFIERRMAELDLTKVMLQLLGGEPTMHLDYCLELLRGCAELGLAGASMISNGTLLTAPAAVALERAGLQWVQISFDGDIAAHDTSRITVGGRGTFDRILRNIEEASAKTGLSWRLRVNLSSDSIMGVDPLIDRLSRRLDTSKFTINFALVEDMGFGYRNIVRHSADLAERVSGLYQRAIDAGFAVKMPRNSVCTFCDAVGGTTGSVINSDGTLYSCAHSAGQEGFDLGTVTDGYLAEDVVAARWVRCGYASANTRDREAEQRYSDTVAAALLDRLYADGLLATMMNRHHVGADHR